MSASPVPAKIKSMFAKLSAAATQAEKDAVLSELQPVITYASIAVDECDFGTGLEVGIDLFCSGIKELEASAVSSLCSSYMLLNRNAFANIFEVSISVQHRPTTQTQIVYCIPNVLITVIHSSSNSLIHCWTCTSPV